jgi:hypothetical protein
VVAAAAAPGPVSQKWIVERDKLVVSRPAATTAASTSLTAIGVCLVCLCGHSRLRAGHICSGASRLVSDELSVLAHVDRRRRRARSGGWRPRWSSSSFTSGIARVHMRRSGAASRYALLASRVPICVSMFVFVCVCVGLVLVHCRRLETATR